MPSTMLSTGAAAQGAHPPLFHKTKICKFYLAGKCKRSWGCKYAHDEKELRPMPDFSRTRLCPFMDCEGVCPKGAKCSFAHAPEELRARTPEHAKILEDFRAFMEEKSPKAESGEVSPVSTLASTAVSTPFSASQEAGFMMPLREAARSPREAAHSPGAAEPPVCGKAKALARTDSDSDFSIQWSSEYSRQSTDVPLDEWSSQTWSRQSTTNQEWGQIPGAVSAAGEILENTELGNLATTLGLAMSMKNTFLAFCDEDEELPKASLRRARSTGALPRAC